MNIHRIDSRDVESKQSGADDDPPLDEADEGDVTRVFGGCVPEFMNCTSIFRRCAHTYALAEFATFVETPYKNKYRQCVRCLCACEFMSSEGDEDSRMTTNADQVEGSVSEETRRAHGAPQHALQVLSPKL
jgi:hypothetical protein